MMDSEEVLPVQHDSSTQQIFNMKAYKLYLMVRASICFCEIQIY